MKTKFKKILFIWLGVGIIITSCLYFYQKDQNEGKMFVLDKSRYIDSNVSSISEKVRTYYEYVGVATLGGALIILGLGFKEKKEV